LDYTLRADSGSAGRLLSGAGAALPRVKI